MNIINNKYKIINRIGSGSFGSIYKAQNIRTKEFVAIKVEPIKDNLKLLKNESNIYNYLNGLKCVPILKWFGKDETNYYMVINLLGISLQELKNKMLKIPLTLVLKIGIKIINILRLIHEKGLVHRDIKPDNFLFGVNSFHIYLIDFGFCKLYVHDGIHNQAKKTHNLIGSMNYASISSHKRCELSRRDDLESLGYMLLYFINGTLPWNNDNNEKEVVLKKINIINDSCYPNILLDYLRYVTSLKYEEKPNYDFIIDYFTKEIELLS
jgi:serine/threonine protein kinase